MHTHRPHHNHYICSTQTNHGAQHADEPLSWIDMHINTTFFFLPPKFNTYELSCQCVILLLSSTGHVQEWSNIGSSLTEKKPGSLSYWNHTKSSTHIHVLMHKNTHAYIYIHIHTHTHTETQLDRRWHMHAYSAACIEPQCSNLCVVSIIFIADNNFFEPQREKKISWYDFAFHFGWIRLTCASTIRYCFTAFNQTHSQH